MSALARVRALAVAHIADTSRAMGLAQDQLDKLVAAHGQRSLAAARPARHDCYLPGLVGHFGTGFRYFCCCCCCCSRPSSFVPAHLWFPPILSLPPIAHPLGDVRVPGRRAAGRTTLEATEWVSATFVVGRLSLGLAPVGNKIIITQGTKADSSSKVIPLSLYLYLSTSISLPLSLYLYLSTSVSLPLSLYLCLSSSKVMGLPLRCFSPPERQCQAAAQRSCLSLFPQP